MPSTALILVKRSVPMTNLADVRLFEGDLVRVGMSGYYHI